MARRAIVLPRSAFSSRRLSVHRFTLRHTKLRGVVVMAQQDSTREKYRICYRLERQICDGEFEEIDFGNTLVYDSIDDAVAEAVSSMTECGIYVPGRAR